MERDRAAILGEIERLEEKATRNPSDEASITRLQLLRDQRTRFDSKIASVQNEQARDVDQHQRTLGDALDGAQSLIIEAEQPRLKAMTAQVTEALAPFFKDQSKLEFAVMRTEMLQSFKGFLGNLDVGPLHEKPQRALVILDKILADGDCGWSWHTAAARAAAPVLVA